MNPDVALIGPGKVGCAVTQRLQMAGYPISAVIGRDLDRAIDGCGFIGCSAAVASTNLETANQSEIILLAVPDDQITGLTKELAEQSPSLTGKTLIHFSGLHAAEIMKTANHGAATLSIHPLLPFANRQIASERLTNCPCALEGDERSIPLGTALIKAFRGQPFRIDSEKKALYHASACIASNFLVTLQAVAAELLVECGIEAEQAIPLLLPLVQASIDNVATLGPEQGLTGPIVRGDTGTVAAHLSALGNSSKNLRELYKQLGGLTTRLAEKSTRLPSKQAEQIQRLLNSEQNNIF